MKIIDMMKYTIIYIYIRIKLKIIYSMKNILIK